MSFGSQGIVQDVITGLTLVFTDLLDVGDLGDLGGQVGIVESVGMRFSVLVNFSGARVYVPNRSIINVVNYRRGHVRAYLDARLPENRDVHEAASLRLKVLAFAAFEQFPGILLLPPRIEKGVETQAGYRYVRIEFRIWPGQGSLLEGAFKASVAQALREFDASYADWMVTVHYRGEPERSSTPRNLRQAIPIHDSANPTE